METKNLLLTMDSLDKPSTEEFIEKYESKNKPELIKNLPLDWAAFKWSDKHVANTIGYPGYDKFIKEYPTYINNYSPGKYLADIPLAHSPLSHDYDTPTLFRDAECQPNGWKWLFWGPPNCGTQVHQDVDHSQAWNVCIKGHKYWWFWYKGKCLNTISGPGDIIFAPTDVWHAVTNLTSSISITHNYKRTGKKTVWGSWFW